jgi:carbon monoxide dehydrogenase subunit G
VQLDNKFTVPAPVSEVWKTLLDMERIAPCMPGATVDRVDGDEVAGRVRVKVGPITARYAGTARFVTKDEASHRAVLEASGRETRGSGTASATVEVTMSEQGAVTQVRVVTSLEITGKQAQFGRGSRRGRPAHASHAVRPGA